MLPHQRLRGVAHTDGVEWLGNERVRLIGENVGNLSTPDLINVTLRFRGEAAVEIIRYRLDGGDADVVREKVVESLAKAARLDPERHIGMCALRACVNARICPPGSFDADRFSEHRGQRILDHVLDSGRVRLRLPAGVTRAKVLKREENAHGGATSCSRSA